jgi:hypothetical protein
MNNAFERGSGTRVIRNESLTTRYPEYRIEEIGMPEAFMESNQNIKMAKASFGRARWWHQIRSYMRGR